MTNRKMTKTNTFKYTCRRGHGQYTIAATYRPFYAPMCPTCVPNETRPYGKYEYIVS